MATIPITAAVKHITSFETEVEIQVDATLLVRMVALLGAAITYAGKTNTTDATMERAKTFERYLEGHR